MDKMITVAADFSVTAQIAPADVPMIAAAGFRSIMCNRPDAEEPDQPSAASICDAASAAELAFIHLPVATRTISSMDARAMRRALDSLPKPILAYCRSGARSMAMHAAMSAVAVGSSAATPSARSA